MDSIIVMFYSSTSAVRLKDALEKQGFYAKVIQTPAYLSQGGCNYSVRAEEAALKEAINIIKKIGLRIRGIYKDTNEISKGRYIKLSGPELP